MFFSCQAFIELASNVDLTSNVFFQMPSGKETITRLTRDIHHNVLQPELIKDLNKTLFRDLIINENTEHQMGLYVHYASLEQQCIVAAFLEMKHIFCHPTVAALFDVVMTPEGGCLALPTDQLASFTCNRAPVALTQKNGVAAKLKASVNAMLFIVHTSLHVSLRHW